MLRTIIGEGGSGARCTSPAISFSFESAIAGAGLVDDADPGGQIHEAVVRILAGVEDQVVVGPPGDATGLVGDARALRAAARRVDVPQQRGPRDEAARQLAEAQRRVVAQRGERAVTAAQHEAIHRRQQRAADGAGAAGQVALDGQRPVDVFQQQLVGAHQVELEVLLQHARGRVGERGEGHRGRIDQRRHIGEAQLRTAGAQLHVALGAHQRIAGHAHGVGGALTGQRPVVLGRHRAGLRGTVDGDGGVIGSGCRSMGQRGSHQRHRRPVT